MLRNERFGVGLGEAFVGDISINVRNHVGR
jgi:hypothetical protein